MPTARGLAPALDANLEILPYQLEPALAVADGARRILIADEVGLGKTVQAALVIAQLKQRRPALRAMVIVPRSLREQWLQELNGRFRLEADVGDREGLQVSSRNLGNTRNPWVRSGVWVVSADYLKQPHVFDALPPQPWDIVIVDEAHDACGASARYEASDEMARRARHVLLLTATPHTGDSARFERLETFGQLPDLDDPLTTFRRTRGALGQATNRRVRWSPIALAPAVLAVLDALSGFERAVLGATSDRNRDGAVLLLSILRKRALSTMGALHVSLERRLGWISGRGGDFIEWFQPRLDLEDSDDGRGDDDCAGLTAESGLSAGAERTWLRRLRALTGAALRSDSKVRHLVRLLHRTHESVLIFTEFRHSLEIVKSAIDRDLPVQRRVVVLHGALTPSERAVAIDRFRRRDASVLLATDVASQGLNLQDCARWVISLELPWTPARIEQRIGRIDRIGQIRPVHATLFLARHPFENGILARLASRTLNVKGALGEDALTGIAPPTERVIADSLFAGRAEIEQRPAVRAPIFTSSDRWRRHARAVARQIMAKRALNRRWQTPEDPTGRPCLVGLRRSACQARQIVLVVTAPILDSTGFLVERRLVALATDEPGAKRFSRLVRSQVFHEWLADRLRPRIARLQRNAVAVSTVSARVDRAIAAHLAGAGWPREVQVGLFDRRAGRTFTAAREEAETIEHEAAGRALSWQAAGELELGEPSIELVLVLHR